MSNCLESVNVPSIEVYTSDCRREMWLSICAGHSTLAGISWARLNLKQVIQGLRETNSSDTRLRKSTHVSSWMLWDRNIFLSKRKRNKFDAAVTAVAISASWCAMRGEWMWADSAPRYLDTAGRRPHLGCAGRELRHQGMKNDGKNVLLLLQQRIKQKEAK